ncbi:hypothetical protein [Entomospira culicis]|uniref:Uncharacterized protein n=1 Tax=Entomospira culicis TaxID=2719989 RepID=A0A968GJ12_9SPIO|nr:hypothetical protein [Entomospira culicis]NIZ19733.1 hypothetical protein [Entomospira culicis]NIZ69947.1 hypothetical protein [Entomospira culicis]WDI37052.1 hypothetical protein PVA46_06960 [Entomospira culicis]WDI38681.1 hypothetical protein PVA47_06970 [Entomospira culicis]
MLLISFLSCTKKKIDYLQLPEHSIISQDRYWGVVRVPYLRLSAGIVDEGQIEGILRAGDVVHILEIRSVYQQEAGFWRDYYHVKSVTSTLTGWITSDALELFLYEEAARRNSDRFRQRDGA